MSSPSDYRAHRLAPERQWPLYLTETWPERYSSAEDAQNSHARRIIALAKKGILYQNAFCTGPVCAPSRYALITGAPAESNEPANGRLPGVHAASMLHGLAGSETEPSKTAAHAEPSRSTSVADQRVSVPAKAVFSTRKNGAPERMRTSDPHVVGCSLERLLSGPPRGAVTSGIGALPT